MIGTLLIRADASTTIGTGHVMRCIALGQEWLSRGGDVVMLSVELPIALAQRLEVEGIVSKPLTCSSGSDNDLLQTINAAKVLDAQWIVADAYHFDLAYQQGVRQAGYLLCMIDDYAHRPNYEADIVLNQNVGADHIRYGKQKVGQWLLGSQYAMLRNEFLETTRERPEKDLDQPWNLLVTLGGSDLDNITRVVLLGLAELTCCWRAVIVVGGANPHRQDLESLVLNQNLPVTLVYDSYGMPELMREADLAISAGGSTCWELCYLGVPVALIAAAENQRGIVSGLARCGAAFDCGWHVDLNARWISETIDLVLANPVSMKDFATKAASIVDGKGRARIVSRMLRMLYPYNFRRAEMRDATALYELATDPHIRRMYFSQRKIDWQEHLHWLETKLQTKNCILLVGLIREDVVAQVRIDRGAYECALSICVDSRYRRMGLAKRMLIDALEVAQKQWGTIKLIAQIKRDNISSIKLFCAVGFSLDDTSSENASYLTLRLVVDSSSRVVDISRK